MVDLWFCVGSFCLTLSQAFMYERCNFLWSMIDESWKPTNWYELLNMLQFLQQLFSDLMNIDD